MSLKQICRLGSPRQCKPLLGSKMSYLVLFYRFPVQGTPIEIFRSSPPVVAVVGRSDVEQCRLRRLTPQL